MAGVPANEEAVARSGDATMAAVEVFATVTPRQVSSTAVGSQFASRGRQQKSGNGPSALPSAMSASAVTTVASAPLQVHRVPCRPSNYAWIVHEPQAQVTAVVDTPELEPIVAALDALGLRLDYVLNTHHHMDHVGGNLELKRRFGCKVVGPKADEDRIPGIDTAVGDGDVWRLGALDVHVLDTPGHTRGHITYHVPQAEALFPGDTLFLMGCGRLFEGTPGQMWTSLQKLMPLPPSTKVYCAHEYTQANAKWALHVDPENPALQQRAAQVDRVRACGDATVPGTLAEELETNPFLRPSDPGIRRALAISDSASDADAFAAIRAHKDGF